ncbi:MAG: methyltransferase type 12 [Alphaproteobacteria bacterium HGW-Alphaproteobacteria-2]|nr:MAG: methyltransferase type 12 [Alphaproteobacteria bacterium HGW-Alphaproteobacteria-2]
MRCPTCRATLLDPAQHPDLATEKAQYDLHRNDPADPRYRAFLNRLAAPLRARLAPGAEGLDYGCGPGPALAAMLAEAGHPMAMWDPIYAPDPAPLARRYDFVTCTEVAEHLHRPADSFDAMCALVRPGGWLGIMTCFQTDDAAFERWHYRLDPTHVAFYRRETLAHLASLRRWRFESPAKDIVLMQRPA